QRNPMKTQFLSASFSSDTRSPGIGTDLNYRDPWGNEYIITMDLNDDNKAEDPFYGPAWMSSSTGTATSPLGPGINGLTYEEYDNYYQYHGNVMVWSMGPNGPLNNSPSSFTYPPTQPKQPISTAWAMDPSNKRHILSWAQ